MRFGKFVGKTYVNELGTYSRTVSMVTFETEHTKNLTSQKGNGKRGGGKTRVFTGHDIKFNIH